MEFVISVPPYLHPLVEWLGLLWTRLQNGWLLAGNAATECHLAFQRVLALPYSNVFLPVVGIILVFWPILLSLVVAIFSAYAWILWLFTSLLLGVLQVGYASYQFFIIAMDIGGLSVLKAFTIVRSQFLHLFWDGKGRKSRRRIWQQRLEEAGSYENFLKIRIEPKDVQSQPEPTKETSKDAVDAALPSVGVKRSQSFSGIGEVTSALESPTKEGRSSPPGTPASKRGSIPRNRSFSSELALQQQEMDHDPAVLEELGRKTADLLVTTTNRLEEARLAAQNNVNDEESANSLKYLLAGVVKRNHLKLEDILIENARSVAESGQYGLSKQSRQLIRSYYQEVERGLDWIAEAPVLRQPSDENKDGFPFERTSDLGERIRLVRKMKQNIGCTALMLSGGGAQAMYHLGVIRALIESKLYDDIKVISGTSGGSITAGMCAIKTADELFADVCVPTISTDYMLTGEMKKKNIAWFPPMVEMASYWMKNKLLVDSDFFRRTCEYYYKDFTFEEAFLRTGKHVCITVSASRASGSTEQRLLLNHISTPHVTIASA